MRMLTFAAALAATGGVADAASLVITGTPGAGTVTVAASGTATPRGDGNILALSETFFNNTRDLQYLGFITNTAIQNQTVALTGNLTISQGANSAVISALFLDDDGASDDNDDLGFRSNDVLNYTTAAGLLSFSGSATMALDITDFGLIDKTASFNAQSFVNGDQLWITVSQTAPVPLPAGLPLLLAGFGGLVVVRRAQRGSV